MRRRKQRCWKLFEENQKHLTSAGNMQISVSIENLICLISSNYIFDLSCSLYLFLTRMMACSRSLVYLKEKTNKVVTQRRQQDRGLKHKVYWPWTCCQSHMTERKKSERNWVQLLIANEDFLLLSHFSFCFEEKSPLFSKRFPPFTELLLQDLLVAFGNFLLTSVLFIFQKSWLE